MTRLDRHVALLATLPMNLEERASAQLKTEKPSTWRARYGRRDLSGAVRAAARIAHRIDAPVLVVALIVYGGAQWVVEPAGSATLEGSLSVARVNGSTVFCVDAGQSIARVDWQAVFAAAA